MPAEITVHSRLLLAFCGILLVSLCALSANIVRESGEATLAFVFMEYINDDGKLSDGALCDTNFQGIKQSDCDPTFRFEVIREGEKGSTLFSYTQATHYTDKNVISFGMRFGEIDNPMEFPVRMVEIGDIFVKLRVEDHDSSGSNDLMDIFVHILEKKRGLQDVDLVSKTTSHRLVFRFEYQCKRHTYGPLCTQKCQAQDDDANGHFTCSWYGDKVCLPGWMYPEKDCKVPDWCRWC